MYFLGSVRCRVKVVALHFVLLLSAASGFSAEPSVTDKGEGKALIEAVLSRVPPENTQVLGLLKIRPADGPITEIPTKMSVRVTPGFWEDTYETQPVLGHPGEVLVVRHRGTEPNQYLYGRYQNRG